MPPPYSDPRIPHPSTLVRPATRPAGKAPNWQNVWVGEEVGVFLWDQAEKYVKGVPNAKYKGYRTWHDAYEKYAEKYEQGLVERIPTEPIHQGTPSSPISVSSRYPTPAPGTSVWPIAVNSSPGDHHHDPLYVSSSPAAPRRAPSHAGHASAAVAPAPAIARAPSHAGHASAAVAPAPAIARSATAAAAPAIPRAEPRRREHAEASRIGPAIAAQRASRQVAPASEPPRRRPVEHAPSTYTASPSHSRRAPPSRSPSVHSIDSSPPSSPTPRRHEPAAVPSSPPHPRSTGPRVERVLFPQTAQRAPAEPEAQPTTTAQMHQVIDQVGVAMGGMLERGYEVNVSLNFQVRPPSVPPPSPAANHRGPTPEYDTDGTISLFEDLMSTPTLSTVDEDDFGTYLTTADRERIDDLPNRTPSPCVRYAGPRI